MAAATLTALDLDRATDAEAPSTAEQRRMVELAGTAQDLGTVTACCSWSQNIVAARGNKQRRAWTQKSVSVTWPSGTPVWRSGASV